MFVKHSGGVRHVYLCVDSVEGSRPGAEILIVKSSHIVKLGEWITLLKDQG